MFSIKRPEIKLKNKRINSIGLTIDDYTGGPSTLCGGCGHDSVTAAIISACFELSIPPETVAKMSGIGCSSTTPGYFLKTAHAFNAVHGRMPSVTTGACAAHRGMKFLAVSGDGDTGSIGLGQFIHALRRKLSMLYIIENNGVYGLTKGQFSALADSRSKNRKGEENRWSPIDPVRMAIEMGASFVARGFSGDKAQLTPLIKAGLASKGFALLEVLSPCVSFNNHQGSTKSYDYIRANEEEATHITDFAPVREEISLPPSGSGVRDVTLHDGSLIRLRKAEGGPGYGNAKEALQFLESCQNKGEIGTGLLYLDSEPEDFHDLTGTSQRPLRDLPLEELIPGEPQLQALNREFR